MKHGLYSVLLFINTVLFSMRMAVNPLFPTLYKDNGFERKSIEKMFDATRTEENLCRYVSITRGEAEDERQTVQ